MGEPRQHVVAAQAVSATNRERRGIPRSDAPSPVLLEDNAYLSRSTDPGSSRQAQRRVWQAVAVVRARCSRSPRCSRRGALGGCGRPAAQRRADGGAGHRRVQGIARRRSPRCTPRPTSCSAAGPTAFSALLARAARPPGRRQQVGLVVRTLPVRVPGLPAGRRSRYGKRVAFVGIDGKDHNGSASGLPASSSR